MARPSLQTTAVVLERPEHVALNSLPLSTPGDDDIVVDIAWSGISTGTERLLFTGRMPPFPGMGYPLVPGYESVGTVIAAGDAAASRVGEKVFVPGARCFGEVRGLFGGAASRLVVSGERAWTIDNDLGAESILLALAATAHHALAMPNATPPDLIVGHGVLGRLLARISIALGNPPPVVWEKSASRRSGAEGYAVIDPADDDRRNYRSIYDVSGDVGIIDELVSRLAPASEIVLAGFYSEPIAFKFPPAFMREARFRIAAEWRGSDMIIARDLVQRRVLSLNGLLTHRSPATQAVSAYETAFHDPDCLKMILDWSATA